MHHVHVLTMMITDPLITILLLLLFLILHSSEAWCDTTED